MSLIDDLKTAEKLVQSVLRDCPETRADDRKLMLRVWEIQGFHLTAEQQNMFNKVLPTETISRARRKIQERGIYLPLQPVYEQRQLLDNEVRNFIKENHD